METKQDLPILLFASRQAWEDWLNEHHATAKGLWIKFAKKGSGVESVKYAEAVEVALCYGWIDGQAASLDSAFSLQRFTPRGPRSNWSKINCARVEKLIEQGRMRTAGLAAVEKAKSDGRWERAYDSPSTATVPDDLQREFEQHPEAAAFFVTLDSTNRYAVLYRIQDAKRPETRARRIARFVAMLSRHEKLHP